MGDGAGDRQAVAVLHQRVSHVAELRFLALRLFVEAALGIGHAGMRLVRALLLVKIPAVSARAVLGLEAPVARPSFDQRAIDREMLVG